MSGEAPDLWILGGTGNGKAGYTFGPLTAFPMHHMLDLPPRSYIIKGLMAPAEMSLIVGPPKCGKSFLALHLAYTVAQGRLAFGRRVHSCTVLYVAAEGEAGIAKRLKALAGEHGVADNLYVVAQPVDLLHGDALQSLIQMARALDAGLIVIDTLNRVLAGGDENSPEDMGTLVANLSDLRHQTGAHLAVVHHGTKASDGRTPRGHSCLIGAVDLILEVAKVEGGDRRASIAAAKDDADGLDLGFRLRQVDLGRDEDNDLITTLMVEELDTAPRRQPKLSPTERGARDALASLIAGHGSPLPAGSDFPLNVHGVQEEAWLAECETRRVSSAERERDRRRAIRQAFAALLEVGIIAARGGWVWLAR
jgi:archaellum biogenesis ATPase FlaH